MAMVECESVDVFYGDNHAIKSVDLEVPQYVVQAFIGPSGCGKSTLLRAINRMNDTIEGCRMSGVIRIDGTDVLTDETDVVDLRRRVGMVFQKPNPFPMSIFDNVAYGLRIGGLRDRSELAERVRAALAQAALLDEVESRLDQPALGLSGGQQQRRCIARALAVKPEVLLMDEPTSALDPIATEKIESLIGDLKRDVTIVIVTHNMQQAQRIADRTSVFYLGELIEDGTTEQVFGDPQDKRARDYVKGAFG